MDYTNYLYYYKKPILSPFYAVRNSPGYGVKAAMIHSNSDPLLHSDLVRQVKDRLYPNTPEFDMNCTDICRSCFMYYDPDLFINIDQGLRGFQLMYTKTISYNDTDK